MKKPQANEAVALNVAPMLRPRRHRAADAVRHADGTGGAIGMASCDYLV
jgi:hypothetical protein